MCGEEVRNEWTHLNIFSMKFYEIIWQSILLCAKYTIPNVCVFCFIFVHTHTHNHNHIYRWTAHVIDQISSIVRDVPLPLLCVWAATAHLNIVRDHTVLICSNLFRVACICVRFICLHFKLN